MSTRSPWERIEERLERGLDAERFRWLCGCGKSAPIEGPAYPVCECGRRMRILDHPDLKGYAR